MPRFPKPRKFIPKNKEKYIGDANNIISRSGYETRMMNFCDQNSGVEFWTSETIEIPYFLETDGKMHRYYPDLTIIKVNSRGIKETVMIEIKPYSQSIPPKLPKSKKQTKGYLIECETYMKNQAKWRAAKEFCLKRGWKFVVLTEKEIFLKKKKT